MKALYRPTAFLSGTLQKVATRASSCHRRSLSIQAADRDKSFRPSRLQAARTRLLETKPVYIKQSSLSGAGRGVFAARDLSKGELLTEYTGKYLYSELERLEYEEQLDDKGQKEFLESYAIDVSAEGPIIYGDPYVNGPEQGVGQIINDCGCIGPQDVDDLSAAIQQYIQGIKRANATWEVIDRHMFAVAVVDIPKDQEVFYSYTSRWWLSRIRQELLQSACLCIRYRWKGYVPREVDFASSDMTGIRNAWQTIRMVEHASESFLSAERQAVEELDPQSVALVHALEPLEDWLEEEVEYGLAGCSWCLKLHKKQRVQ